MATFFVFSSTIAFAQKASYINTKLGENTCSATPFEMPGFVQTKNQAFANYIKVMSLPPGARQSAFSALSNKDKADVFRVKLALQLAHRADFSRAQKDVIVGAISNTTADT